MSAPAVEDKHERRGPTRRLRLWNMEEVRFMPSTFRCSCLSSAGARPRRFLVLDNSEPSRAMTEALTTRKTMVLRIGSSGLPDICFLEITA
jgi:hypothetical protein